MGELRLTGRILELPTAAMTSLQVFWKWQIAWILQGLRSAGVMPNSTTCPVDPQPPGSEQQLFEDAFPVTDSFGSA